MNASSDTSSSAAKEPPPASVVRLSGWRGAVADVGRGARAVMPEVARIGSRIGDWLATVGWGKFFLLAILAMMLGGMLGEVLYGRSPGVVVEQAAEPAVHLNVSVSSAGVRISDPAASSQPGRPPGRPVAPVPSGPSSTSVEEPSVRIRADKDGEQVGIVIDGKGIRIERAPAPPSSAGSAPGAGGGEVQLPPETIDDPEKMAAAIEAARDRIEKIVAQQIDRQVAQRARAYRQRSGDWLLTFVTLLVITGVIVKIVLGSKRRAEVRAQAATATAAEEGLKRQLAEARLKMMQAQVEPHFLFNTLASVDYLIETDPPRASRMQKNLIQYLRAALPQMREGSTTLGNEAALCRAYLEILKVRMEDRLQYAINVPQGLASAQFPPMMLQSLVENAIRHGLEPKTEGGTLTLSADIAHGRLRVTVADTGLGFGASGTGGSGVGLANVRERLTALYGGAAKLQVEANTPTGTIATIEVPYAPDAAAASSARAAESAD